jgi:drug/metabolite transporter (DMT)-like permease
MSHQTLAILATIGICIVSATADYSLKRASLLSSPASSPWFYFGLIIYGSTAFAWVYVMRHLQFATLGVVYASAMVVLLAGIGVFILHETLRWQEALGIVLAIASIILLSRFTG